MIDLRSDTLTRPTDAMRRTMLDAPVGDDVYAEDPTVAELEARVAELLGHEAGLFTPTGSMANLLGVWLLVPAGAEVLCDQQAHIVRAELGAHAQLHGITSRTWATPDGIVDAATVSAAIAPDNGPFLVRTGAIEIENTHNFGGGTVHSLDTLRQIRRVADDAGLPMHLDGARLWNAHVATGAALRDYGELFQTVSVCLSKGLGAPVGSVLVSSAQNIARARIQRKRLGGGWRQAGMLAAAGLYALDHHVERLADDHAAARAFAEAVALAAPGSVEPEKVPTNIVIVRTGERPAGDVVAAAAARGVALSAVGAHLVRAVTHLDVSLDDCREAGRILGELLGS
ncbi:MULTISPECIES: threonine aldolase family protein [unclassified Luteococcus]|uniref:threonine aldolase family protein n=1 Tax=unclassified Luteococcus TaxID=2639923 RepID=UPI00313BD7F7